MAFKQNRKAGTKLDSYEGMQGKGLLGGGDRFIINPNKQIHKEYRVPERRSNSRNAKGKPTFKFDGTKKNFVMSGARKKHIANKIHQTVQNSILPGVSIFIKRNKESKI